MPEIRHFMFSQTGKSVTIALILMGAGSWITAPVAHSEPLKIEYKNPLSVVRDGALMSFHSPVSEPRAVKKLTITAYSSSPDETDETPEITASGTKTRPGVVAANFLPFGTKVRIPHLFGDRVFTVEDRMHSRFQNRMDIWFPSKQEAKRFGLQFTEVEIEI